MVESDLGLGDSWCKRPGRKHAAVDLVCLGGSNSGWILVKFTDSCEASEGLPVRLELVIGNGSPSWFALETMWRFSKGVSSSPLGSQYCIKDKSALREGVSHWAEMIRR